MAQITPPVGFNLFVIQGLPGYNILQVARATLPFFFLLLAAVIIISVFPEIVTYPNRCRGAEAKIVAREYKGSFQFNERVS